jgi:hypothetical protein
MGDELYGYLKLSILRFTDNWIPTWVECSFLDSSGVAHVFEEKVPIVTAENLDENSDYPKRGILLVSVVSQWRDEGGGELMRILTGALNKADGTDEQEFTVFSSQVVLSADTTFSSEDFFRMTSS